MPDGSFDPVLLDEIKTLAASLKVAGDDVKKQAETTTIELRNLGKVTDETKESADKALIKQAELEARVREVEQKMIGVGPGSPAHAKSIGEQFVENPEVIEFLARRTRGVVKMSFKAITSVTTDADGSAGDLIRPQRVGGLIVPPMRRMTVRDLLTPGNTTSNAIEYVKETGFTNNAAVVAEGAQKPESTLKFDLVTTTVTTIAHWMHASKQVLDDAAQLRSHIDGRLRYGLAYVEELQLLSGSGSGGNLNGIYTQATAYSAPITLTSPTSIDTLRLAILQSALALYPVTGMVMNPSDWARIELTKTDDGAYLFANPQGIVGPTLWGRPVVETPAMAVDSFLVGAFRMGAQIFDREGADVMVSTEDRDNFIKNMVTILAEERLGLAVYRPEAFIKGDFGLVA